MVVGEADKLWDEGAQGRPLQLQSTFTTKTGVQVLTYSPPDRGADRQTVNRPTSSVSRRASR
ncbi:hypothetical protein GCM10020358_24260 [Amorphoplanes nipponensis]|uniref:hypothetical protein n=1 Tax=Actinoplanes nipponensis TaxID=135950 RepID=UPI0031EE9274